MRVPQIRSLPMPVLLTEQDVRRVLAMPDLIEAMAQALGAFSSGGVTQPVRTTLEIGSDPAFFAVMPAALAHPAAMGAKLVTVYHRNHNRGLPSHLATIVLLDHATGALVGLVDGRYITEARTAAVSAVSAKFLACRDAKTVAILGSGVQAKSHLEALRHVASLADVRVWSPTRAHCEAFAREHSTPALPVRAAASASEDARDADIIVLATASKVPVLDSVDVSDGAHICAVGACRPDQREMSTSLVTRARVFVDSRAGALKEAGDLLLPMGEGAITADHIAGELGDLVSGDVKGRSSTGDVTIFKSLGMAVEDVVAAHLAVTRAKAQGVGKTIEL
jgi:alanine dehydrogenase